MSSDLRYIFPTKKHVSFVGTLCTRTSSNFKIYLKILNKERKKKHSKIILHLRVIISWQYKGSQNQVVVMFQTGSSKNAITRRF